jgi:hypothetical protein
MIVVAQRLAARLRPKPPGMVGTPPSARTIPAIPADPAEHAADFAIRWVDRLESYVEQRMLALDVPEEVLGNPDFVNKFARRAFIPYERRGGHGTPGLEFRGINVDSGVLNPDLLAGFPLPGVSSLWARARLRDRIDAVIAHELEEAAGFGHTEALRRAPDTPLRISEGARKLLRAIAGRTL